MHGWFEEKDGLVVLNVRVTPRAARNEIAGVMGGEVLKIRIQAPPVEGKANACLLKYLSGLWNVPRAKIEILSGRNGRTKRILIRHPSSDLLHALASIDDS